jgi:ubiquinol-cytochrome c reductase cytochrome b subunit
MIRPLIDWVDDRMGVQRMLHEALYERIPSGARFRYVTGSMLVFAFATQAITGIFLWMAYSPSSQTAYESTYYIQHEMAGGWLLRGIHHFMAQAMVVVMALHLLQVVWDGAYRKPREFNYWIGLVLMQIVLGLGLTGYLLPWDQKGYWATNVATNLATLVPVFGKQIQQLAIGGTEYGHHTLTRFFAMHTGVLPALLVAFLVAHIAGFRRHGITAKITPGRADEYFWPKQVLFDAIGCAVLLTIVLLLVVHFNVGGALTGTLPPEHRGAELGAPADPAEAYSAARPEWYYLFLFQFLKYFPGKSEIWGAIIIPGIVMGVLFLLPLIGRLKHGHTFNRAFIILLLMGAGILTLLAYSEDYFVNVAAWLNWTEGSAADGEKKTTYPKWLFMRTRIDEQGQKKRIDAFNAAVSASRDFLQAKKDAEHDAHRIDELINRRETLEDGKLSDVRMIPKQGAVYLLRNDPMTRGSRLFGQHCASCHDYVDPEGKSPWNFANVTRSPKTDAEGKKVVRDKSGNVVYPDAAPSGAPNLFGFASRAWIKGLLNKDLIGKIEYGKPSPSPDRELAADKDHPDNHKQPIIAPYFGNTNHKNGRMATWVAQHAEFLKDDPKSKADAVDAIAAALSAQAQLPAQAQADDLDGALITQGLGLMQQNCMNGCHRLGNSGQLGLAPDLTGYGSYEWLMGFVSDPMHERFYRMENDRMPSFAANLEHPERNSVSIRELSLIVDWLRGQYYVADSKTPILPHTEAEAVATVELARTIGNPWTHVVGAPAPKAETKLARAERLFTQNCAACHSHVDASGRGIAAANPSAPNLFGFGSREWLAGLLDPEQIVSPQYFGNTRHKTGDMVGFVDSDLSDPDDGKKMKIADIVAALSAEAALPAQAEADKAAETDGTLERGRAALAEAFDNSSCVDCHKFRDEGDVGSAPDLTGWASQDWLKRFIADPTHGDFYRDTNDRMPAFGRKGPGPTIQPLLSPEDVELVSQWLRGEVKEVKEDE